MRAMVLDRPKQPLQLRDVPKPKQVIDQLVEGTGGAIFSIDEPGVAGARARRGDQDRVGVHFRRSGFPKRVVLAVHDDPEAFALGPQIHAFAGASDK